MVKRAFLAGDGGVRLPGRAAMLDMIDRARAAWEAGDVAGIGAALDYTLARNLGRARGRPTKHPWATMEVGDEYKAGLNSYRSVSAMASNAGRALNRRFSCRGDGHVTIVTRIA